MLNANPLDDEQVDELHEDVKDTPVHVARRITTEVEEGHSSFESLVPRSARYFCRLAGECAQEATLDSFVQSA
ncbi:hypothetical protein, partial [Allomesorhizobium camelthorni]|uniref:hypothetical protein n=1 Tax=Allomesorhizobium camelthorni TaxID=475069 RepID=UPI001981B5BD